MHWWNIALRQPSHLGYLLITTHLPEMPLGNNHIFLKKNRSLSEYVKCSYRVSPHSADSFFQNYNGDAKNNKKKKLIETAP